MRWGFAFALGVVWYILSILADHSANMIIANIWMATSFILATVERGK